MNWNQNTTKERKDNTNETNSANDKAIPIIPND
jgi:hypothetical protein